MQRASWHSTAPWPLSLKVQLTDRQGAATGHVHILALEHDGAQARAEHELDAVLVLRHAVENLQPDDVFQLVLEQVRQPAPSRRPQARWRPPGRRLSLPGSSSRNSYGTKVDPSSRYLCPFRDAFRGLGMSAHGRGRIQQKRVRGVASKSMPTDGRAVRGREVPVQQWYAEAVLGAVAHEQLAEPGEVQRRHLGLLRVGRGACCTCGRVLVSTEALRQLTPKGDTSGTLQERWPSLRPSAAGADRNIGALEDGGGSHGDVCEMRRPQSG